MMTAQSSNSGTGPSAKPQPKPTAETLPFWKACKDQRLIYQFCASCQRAQFPPRSRCAQCHADAITWRESAKRGYVHSFTVVHRAPTPAFKSEVPYVILLVDMAEGFRMMLNVRAAAGAHQTVFVGQRVRVVFEPSTGEYPLPQAEVLE